MEIKTNDALLSNEEFFSLCLLNEGLKMERTAEGEIIVCPPTYSESSAQNSDLNYQLQSWNHREKKGVVFDSNGGFILPNGAMRSPDVAWVNKERLHALPKEKREKFVHLCPDFVIELRSKSDNLKTLLEKMDEWMTNGCQLAWMIDPIEKNVVVHDAEGKRVVNFGFPLSGGEVLKEFLLDYSVFEVEW